jgi:rRNA maturation endonuclease Nob1
MTEKNYSWHDVANFIEVCFSCQGQNINHEQPICEDCGSEDVGSVPPEEVL